MLAACNSRSAVELKCNYILFDKRGDRAVPIAAFKYRAQAVIFMRELCRINESTPILFELVPFYPPLEVNEYVSE